MISDLVIFPLDYSNCFLENQWILVVLLCLLLLVKPKDAHVQLSTYFSELMSDNYKVFFLNIARNFYHTT